MRRYLVTEITFNDKTYTEEALKDATDDQLLELRNLVASNLGVAAIQKFKDRENALSSTWKALQKYDATVKAEAEGSEAPPVEPKEKAKTKTKKPPKEKGPYQIPKSAQPKTVKRPTMNHFSTIKIVGEHNGGSHGRKDRWSNYRDGMMMIDVIEGNGTEPWDVYNWQKHGIMQIIEPTEEEYQKRRAEWYKKKGVEDPEIAKKRKEEAKVEAEE